MPVYAYKCRDCGTPLEAHQEFSDAALTECPTCGGVLRKQYGTIGVTFNGSGFYRTDSRAGSESKDGATSGAESKSDSGKSDSTSDSGAKSDGAKPTASPSTASSGASGSSSSGSSSSGSSSSGASSSSGSSSA